MKHTYRIVISIDLGKAFAPVGDFVNGVNTALAECGCTEQLRVRSKCITATLTSGRELTAGDKAKVKKTMLDEFNAGQPAWNAKIESFRRQSGNAQQSAS